MQYQLLNIDYIEEPKEQTYGDILQTVCITVGVVGDTYGFKQKNIHDVLIPSTKTLTEAKQYVIDECVNYVLTNYPEI